MLSGTTWRRCAALLSIPLLMALMVVHGGAARSHGSSPRSQVTTPVSAASAALARVTAEPSTHATPLDLHVDGGVLAPELAVPLDARRGEAVGVARTEASTATPLTVEGRAPPVA